MESEPTQTVPPAQQSRREFLASIAAATVATHISPLEALQLPSPIAPAWWQNYLHLSEMVRVSSSRLDGFLSGSLEMDPKKSTASILSSAQGKYVEALFDIKHFATTHNITAREVENTISTTLSESAQNVLLQQRARVNTDLSNAVSSDSWTAGFPKTDRPDMNTLEREECQLLNFCIDITHPPDELTVMNSVRDIVKTFEWLEHITEN